MTINPTPDEVVPLCRFGPHCRGRARGVPAPDDGRGLCWGCEMHGQHVVRDLPTLYRQLSGELGKDAGRNGIATFGGAAQVEAPIPLREQVDAMVREIAHVLLTWEAPVREARRLSEAPERGVRYAVAVSRASRILTEHYSVLLALPLTAYMRYTDGPDELDGPGAVVQLADVYWRSERLLGTSVAREPRDGPCPNCHLRQVSHPDGSVTTALSWEIGDDEIRCRSCRWTIRLQDYPGYLMAHTPPDARRRLVRS